MAFTSFFYLFFFLWSRSRASEIELLNCEPPDRPIWGGYGPQQSSYIPGDVVHYFCDADTFIGGHNSRRCEDTGKWSGDIPFCDAPSTFSSTSQSSDADEDSKSDRAVDGIRTTCSETIGFDNDEWSGNFSQPGELIRVMLFLPKGPVSYQIILVKASGEEVLYVSHTANIDRHDWTHHNIHGPDNTDLIGMKIKSLSNEPLKICEIAAYVLTSPWCYDPRVFIENGRLLISRKAATLVCESGYTRSPSSRIECIRNGEWNRKSLFCFEREWELENEETDNRRNGDREPNGSNNPDREKIEA